MTPQEIYEEYLKLSEKDQFLFQRKMNLYKKEREER